MGWRSSRSAEQRRSTWPDPAVPRAAPPGPRVTDLAALDRQRARSSPSAARCCWTVSADPVEPLRVFADPDGRPFCLFVGEPDARRRDRRGQCRSACGTGRVRAAGSALATSPADPATLGACGAVSSAPTTSQTATVMLSRASRAKAAATRVSAAWSRVVGGDQQLDHVRLVDVVGQPVAAQQPTVAGSGALPDQVDARGVLDGSREDLGEQVALRVLPGALRVEHPGVDEQLHVGVVVRDPAAQAVADQVRARVPDVGHPDGVVVAEDAGERGRQPGEAGVVSLTARPARRSPGRAVPSARRRPGRRRRGRSGRRASHESPRARRRHHRRDRPLRRPRTRNRVRTRRSPGSRRGAGR